MHASRWIHFRAISVTHRRLNAVSNHLGDSSPRLNERSGQKNRRNLWGRDTSQREDGRDYHDRRTRIPAAHEPAICAISLLGRTTDSRVTAARTPLPSAKPSRLPQCIPIFGSQNPIVKDMKTPMIRSSLVLPPSNEWIICWFFDGFLRACRSLGPQAHGKTPILTRKGSIFLFRILAPSLTSYPGARARWPARTDAPCRSRRFGANKPRNF